MKYHQQISEVSQRIAPYIIDTPLLRSDKLSQKLEAEVFLKCEILQHTNSFKARGAMNKVLGLPKSSKVLVTASGGNHGLALAYAAKQTGRTATVFVPSTTPEYKITKIRALGGEVTVHGDVWDDTDVFARQFAKDRGAEYVHPFSDDDIIAGQATIAHEMFRTQPDIDVLLVSIGGGGLISGISQYAKSFNAKIKVYGVETVGADSMYQSIRAGHIVELPAITSIAESLGAKRVTEKTFDIVKKQVDDLLTVTDDEALETVVDTLQDEKLLIEPAASCAIAAAKKLPGLKGQKVAFILCGANFPVSKLKDCLDKFGHS